MSFLGVALQSFHSAAWWVDRGVSVRSTASVKYFFSGLFAILHGSNWPGFVAAYAVSALGYTYLLLDGAATGTFLDSP